MAVNQKLLPVGVSMPTLATNIGEIGFNTAALMSLFTPFSFVQPTVLFIKNISKNIQIGTFNLLLANLPHYSAPPV